ncbi:GvpL/GvpF family gas vesicle protein [Streptomyces sp. NPDC060194]|uniref:GvpL/GvpF family gas vesicle protein n=1 Tax=Streptomyces sp. NPDC060194 TaxID=3347069 RepID=UPI003652350B
MDRTHPAAAPPAADTLVYVYAVAQPTEALTEHVGSLGGLGAPPRLVPLPGHDDLAAVVADVPADSFGTDALKAQLEDLDRLEALARAHHGCVDAAATLATVLPLRLTTVYVDDARVAEMLAVNAPAFRRALRLLADQVEVGVKVYADPSAAPAAPEAPPAEARGPGRDYLRRRRAHRDRHADTYRAAGDVAGHAGELAAAYATAHVPHRLQQGALGAARGENVLNDAYLVPRAHVERFAAELAHLRAAPGVTVEVTGPWVPYSFTEWAQTPPEGAP